MPAPRAALACAVLALAACGGDDADEAVPTTTVTTEAPPSSTATTGAEPEEPTTTTISDEGLGDVEAVLQQLLVRPAELGDHGFVDAGYTPDEGANACGVDVDADVPPGALVGARLQSESLQLVVQQEVRAYTSVEEAAAAFAAGREAIRCGTGEPTDVTTEVGGDEAFSVTFADEGSAGTLVVAQVTDVIVTFQLAAAPGADTSALDPLEVAAFGVGKLLAYLEQG